MYFYTWRGNKRSGDADGVLTAQAAEMEALWEAEAKKAAGAAAHRIWAKKEAERIAFEAKAKESEAMLEAHRAKTAANKARGSLVRPYDRPWGQRVSTAPAGAERRHHVAVPMQIVKKAPAVPGQTAAAIARLRAKRAEQFEKLTLSLSPYMATLPPIRHAAAGMHIKHGLLVTA